MLRVDFPLLKSERLTLRQLSKSDEMPIFLLRSDPSVNRYLHRQPCLSVNDAADFINKVNQSIRRRISFYWAIVHTTTDVLVGTICIFNIAEQKKSVEIGFELRPEFQGHGYMKEGAQHVVNFVFQTLQFETIRADAHFSNVRSSKLLSQLNFIKSQDLNVENPDLITYTLNKQSFSAL